MSISARYTYLWHAVFDEEKNLQRVITLLTRAFRTSAQHRLQQIKIHNPVVCFLDKISLEKIIKGLWVKTGKANFTHGKAVHRVKATQKVSAATQMLVQ
jgi:hypothetical protein